MRTAYHPDRPTRQFHGDSPGWAYGPYLCEDCGCELADEDHSVCCPQYWETILNEAICSVVGHSLVDGSSIGPESGTEAHYCIRCPYSWHHVWY